MSPIAPFSSLLSGSCIVLCSVVHVTMQLAPHPCTEQGLLLAALCPGLSQSVSDMNWMEELLALTRLCCSQDVAAAVTALWEPTGVGPFHFDQRSKNLSLFLFL